MADEYKGSEFIYAVTVPAEGADPSRIIRPFNQTDGSSTIESDEVELSTKDKSGSDYGAVTESLSLEGVLTDGDEFISFMKDAIRNRQMVEIYEINTRTKVAEKGSYMVSSFERTYANGEFATYALEATLNGTVTEETLTTVPAGAPTT